MVQNKKGFTLIELLVVIAIIGMLSSVVLVSLGPARKKSRDAKRESDIRQISLAMEMCTDDSACSTIGSYPAITAASGRLTTAAIGTYMPTIPQDPGGGASTSCVTEDSAELTAGAYCAIASSAGSEYCIYAKLSDGNWFAASEKGANIMAGFPASMSACP
jgi:prepilin-type N-terminal cleavage/methylation domain-containing protein